ncbi:Fe(3+)-hydroxamate ABC transporter permease FhuB [Azospirillum brasilense]|uniref:Fe(3+)-hydroxamate ABC transporter permease FhuB n=1 Tax=Azospirillum brasilense TaxID=192 RepID=UPI000E67AA11|nr:Fe(3+)-hydroxamate ABC transporter permease FhuB [Azospirillum brasilense]NUB25183.1 Fe(3+)-hydroxamate ABC transporter permease FhuB [Azospirillum brasilense]NUB31417.1 Fe(3+)-hydroxamate ABC transporter permease FhuB [Azospirillum brasilense]RIW03046.1 Fe(3+)-hydroxamate ABC transporter permease FhuB [Azospirillum brasilense]
MAERAGVNRILLWSGLALAAALLSIRQIAGHAAAPSMPLPPDAAWLDGVILYHSVLPRIAVALVAGAALGLSGLLLQRVLRNPLAEPSTLGVSAGAQLALTLGMLYAPALMDGAREGVALAGGLAAVGLILAMTWRRGLEPVAVMLAGMMVALTATMGSAALILANGEYLFSIFLWGGGALAQQSWGPTLTIAVRLLIGIGAAFLLMRPLAILGLDDASARSLGVALNATRFGVIGVAVWLAASVTAEVGVIGFVGLAAPALAHLSGARTQGQRLVAAPLIGALLLWLTDGLVQLLAGVDGERVPTGAATALLGGPLLLWLLPRLHMFEWPSLNSRPAPSRRSARPYRLIALFAILGAVAVGLALTVGYGPGGWTLSTGPLLDTLLGWRGPRVAVAAAAGAMLAAAGMLLQRVTANPLASPEILGVGTGAGVGLTAALFLVTAPGFGVQLAASAAGAVLTLAAMLALSLRAGFGPERLLLAGIAMSALCSAVLTAVIATGTPQAFALLRWLSGSTNEAGPGDAWFCAGVAVLLLAVLPLTVKWLEILPLGDVTARAVGLPVRRCRILLVLLAGLLTAAAALFVGPLSFIGLIAPHLARLAGLGRPLQQGIGAVLIGAGLMVVSDWLARTVAFPYQLPLGLFAALLAGPYLVWLLGRSNARSP